MYLKIGLLGQSIVFRFCRCGRAAFQCLFSFILISSVRVPVAPPPHQYLALPVFFISSRSDRYVGVSHRGCTPMTNKVEHLFIFIDHRNILLCEGSAQFFFADILGWSITLNLFLGFFQCAYPDKNSLSDI